MAAYRQAKRMQRGVKLGYKQFGNGVNDTRFESAPIPIGTSDFSLELYMNSYGSNQSYPFAFNKRVYSVYAKGSIFLHNSNSYENGIYSILMEAPADGESNADSIYPSWQAPTADEKYLLTITRQGTTVKAYINGELKRHQRAERGEGYGRSPTRYRQLLGRGLRPGVQYVPIR